MAAQDLERLTVQLSADIKKFENAMRKAQGVTNQRFNAIQKKAISSSKGMEVAFARAGVAIVAGLATGRIAKEMLALSEAATRIDNALKVAGLSGKELDDVYKALSKSAKENGAPVETLASLYGKAAQAQTELGASSEDLLNFTDNVALALRVAGTDAQTASGALLQLGQALGSGKVQAEEFNSVLEGARTIAQAVAAGLKEANGSISQLKKLVIDGKVSSEAFFRAFEAGAPILQDKVANATFMVGQATTNLRTALIDVVREFNNSTGASERFAGGINSAAQAIASFDVSGFIQKIRDAKGELDGFLNDLGNAEVFQRLNKLMGITDEQGNVFNPDVSAAETKIAGLERELQLLQERIKVNSELGFDNAEALARISEVRSQLSQLRADAANLPSTIGGYDVVPGAGIVPVPTGAGSTNGQMGGSSTRGGARNNTVTPVSLDDFKPPVGSKSGGGKSRKSDYEREIEQIRERTAALQAETAAQAGLNPLVDDFGYTMEKARAEQELLSAAQKAGLAITPELKASIEALAEGYASASAEAQRLQDSQERIRQAAEDFKSTSKDVVSGFISDLRSGKSAAEALAGALNKVVDKLIDVALNSAFGIGGGGGGLLGGIFSLFGFKDGGPIQALASGGMVRGPGGPRSDKVLMLGSDGEFMVNAAATKKHRALLEAINGGLPAFANGGMVGNAPRLPDLSGIGRKAGAEAVHVTVGVSVDNNGNLMPFVESVSRREVSQAAPKIVSASQARVMPTIANYQQSRAGGDYRG